MNMSKLKSIINELKEIIKRANESLSELTGRNYEGMPLESLPNEIGRVNVFQSPYEIIPEGTHESPLGTYTSNGLPHFICLKKKMNGRTLYSTDGSNVVGGRYDFSFNGIRNMYLQMDTVKGVYWINSLHLLDPIMVIFPDQVNYLYNGTIVINNYPNKSQLSDGLYLPRVGTCTSEWITVIGISNNAQGDPIISNIGQMTNQEINVKCPPNTESYSIYLQALNMSAETMVGIFNNLKNVSSDSMTHKIQVGSTNLAKLTTEQKNIAINKGWILS